MKSAVLFLVFNRPETTKQVFAAIRAARPPRLYISADGHRSHKIGEADLCHEVRHIATQVDWPCEVKTLFHDKNLGCKLGPVTGISWFFTQEEEGIILEDDILPLPSFFTYCDELLERYRDNPKIAMISGNNSITQHTAINDSYFFSNFNAIWGWASWRRSWINYDIAMHGWPAWRDQRGLANISNNHQHFIHFWTNMLNQAYAGEKGDAWDYQWTFACWKNNGLTVLPRNNLIHNIGFGADATHTTGNVPDFLEASAPVDLPLPLQHPTHIECNHALDRLIQDTVFPVTGLWWLLRFIEKVPPLHWLYQKYRLHYKR